MKQRNRICIVTGGANGIGRCIVETFAREGARVAFIDTDAIHGQALADLLTAGGSEVFFMSGDIGDARILESFVCAVVRRWGGADVLVNNACLSRRGLLSGCGADEFNEVLRVGVTAPYLLASLLRPHFHPGAAIVNIGSTRAFMSQADTESYSAAKGGITALTHALAASLAHRVRVNAVHPGWIDTSAWQGMPVRLGGNPVPAPESHANTEGRSIAGSRSIPVSRSATEEACEPEATAASGFSPADLAQHAANRVGTPGDIARAVLFLADGANSFITGQSLTVDGGMSRQMIYHGDEGWTYVPTEFTP